jgi:hypothetical protein
VPLEEDAILPAPYVQQILGASKQLRIGILPGDISGLSASAPIAIIADGGCDF